MELILIYVKHQAPRQGKIERKTHILYLSILIDSKSLVWESAVGFTVNLSWLDLSLTRLLLNKRMKVF